MGLAKLLSHRNSCIMNGPKELFISIRIKWLMKNSAIGILQKRYLKLPITVRNCERDALEKR